MLEWLDGNYAIFQGGGNCLKRRIAALFFCCALILGCAVPVFAENAASYVDNITTLNSNGSCQVTLQVSIHLDSGVDNLTFPLPLGAKDITVNGSSAKATKSDGALQVDISGIVGGYGGDYSLRFDYTLENVVTYSEEKLHLELPILCGFAYPVQALEFAISFPADVETRPYFTGGYRQSTMENIMTTAVTGNLVSGSINQPLDDQETITMTMEVTETMFPLVSTYERTGNPEIVPMVIIGVIALLYWLLTLRNFPFFYTRRPTPPEGVSAGELGCRLTFAGADLTMMVFHWAQLGYILIHLDGKRVYLYKRMDMGNERSLFEVKTFKALFGSKRVIDGTGSQYARLCQKVARQVPGERAMCAKKSGNIKVFLFLNCVIQVFAGVCLAMNFTEQPLLQVILAVILGALGLLTAWKVQEGMYPLHLRGRQKLYLALAVSVLWLLASIFSGAFLVGLISLLVQAIAGLAAAYGGSRSIMGKQNMEQILGLRSFLKTISKEELALLRKNDPEYFFNMVPFAMALGVDKAFSQRHGRKKLPPCPYLVTNRKSGYTAESWDRILQETADLLDARYKQMEWERSAIIHIR